MHIGFQVKVDLDEDEELIKIAETQFSKHEKQILTNLDPFTNPDGVLNGADLQKAWFPQIKADIFLSHSHDDLNIAKTFAGLVYQEFGLITFIDSCVWNHANKLINAIDRKYCKKPSGHYDYDERNRSTSHIHMMLTGALGQVLDQSECLLLLNTPNSIKPYEVKHETFSPWLYFEILLSQIIKKRDKSYYRKTMSKNLTKFYSRANESVQIAHPLNLSHLSLIENDILDKWIEKANKSEHALDTLYNIVLERGEL